MTNKGQPGSVRTTGVDEVLYDIQRGSPDFVVLVLQLLEEERHHSVAMRLGWGEVTPSHDYGMLEPQAPTTMGMLELQAPTAKGMLELQAATTMGMLELQAATTMGMLKPTDDCKAT